MLELLRLYLHLIAARFRGQMQYRVSFSLTLLSSFLITVIEFAGVLVLFGRVRVLAGWTLWEVGLLYAIAETSFASAELVASALDDFQERIVHGTFDRILTRPLGAFFQLLAEDVPLRRLGRVAQGVIVLVLATRYLGVIWTPDKLLVLLVALASGMAIFLSVFVLAATFCFWSTEGKEATHVVSYGGVTLVDYPVDVYADWLKRFVVFVLPLAFVSYYPALYILERPDPLDLPFWVRLLSPVAAIAFGMVASFAWRQGVRHYQSTGS